MWADIAAVIFILTFLSGAIYEMRLRHSAEIFAIWYVFWFFILTFGALYFIAESQSKEVTDVLGTSFSGTLKWFLDAFTDLGGEMKLVGAFIYLGIVPQLFTYVFSGFSGSASAPHFVRQITAVAIWSVIKFMAGLGGITLAHWSTQAWVGKPVNLDELMKALAFLTIAFAMAGVYSRYSLHGLELDMAPGLSIRFYSPAFLRDFLQWLHRKFTRNVRPSSGLNPGIELHVAPGISMRFGADSLLWLHQQLAPPAQAATDASPPTEVPEQEVSLFTAPWGTVYIRGYTADLYRWSKRKREERQKKQASSK
jgi:hypothetical protein